MREGQLIELGQLIGFCTKNKLSIQDYRWSKTEAKRVASVLNESGGTYQIEYVDDCWQYVEQSNGSIGQTK